MKTPSTNAIAVICLLCAVGLMVFLFSESRADPSLRIAALVAGTGLVSTVAAIASTILTGKDLTQRNDPSALPPGSVVKEASSVQTPPIAEDSSSPKKL